MRSAVAVSTVVFMAFLSMVIAKPVSDQSTVNVKDSIARIKKCYSPDMMQFNRCLFEYWKEVRPMLAAGIPDLKVPKLEPLHIDRVEVAENRGAVVQGRAAFTDLTVTGLSGYVPKSFVADIRTRTIAVEIAIPRMKVDGTYDVDGVALLLPVKGHGKFSMELADVAGKAVAHVEREGTGVRLARTDIDFDVGTIATRLDNVLGGEEVGEAINNLINDNAQEILKDVKPVVSAKLSDAIDLVLRGAVKALPAEAFVLPEGFVPPDGITIPPDFTVKS